MWIAGAMDQLGEQQDELWDEADGFFYNVLRLSCRHLSLDRYSMASLTVKVTKC